MLATPIKDHSSYRRPSTRDSNMSPSLRPQTMNQAFFDSPLLTPSPHRNKSAFQPHPEFGGQNCLQSPFQTPVLPSMSWKTTRGEDSAIFSPREPLLTPAKPRYSHAPQSSAQDNTARVGAGIKRKPNPHSTPLRPHTLTPLAVTSRPSEQGSVAFDRLAPLPPPKFGIRTPKTRNETDASIRTQTTSLIHLDINKPKNAFDDDDSGCDISEPPPTGVLFPANKEARRRSSNRLFKDIQATEVAEAISPGGHVTKRRARSRPVSDELLESVRSSPSPAARIAFPKGHHRRKSSESSSSSKAPSPRPRSRTAGLNGPAPARPSHLQHRAPLARVDSATMFFGGPSLQSRSRTNSSLAASVSSNSPARPTVVNRHSFAGLGGNDFWHTIQPRSMLPSPQSSPPSIVDDHAHYTTDDDDDMFQAIPRDSSFVLTVDTPPRGETAAIVSKFRQTRDSGISLSDDDMSMDSSTSAENLMPQASTSVSSIYSDGDDERLVTPGIAPAASSGWPQTRVYGAEDEHGSVDMDAFILRTLTSNSKAPTETKRAPNTPVKKVKTSYLSGDRPWQSAVAHRVGRGIDWEVKTTKVPRKSLPAVFPPTGRKHGKATFDPSTDSEDEPEDSPSIRREKYAGLGMGLPTLGERAPPSLPKPRWLSRRSSSGAFSSGSESVLGTPTRHPNRGSGRIPSLSPSKQSRFSPTRSASGSSTSSFLSSPTTARTRPSPTKARSSMGRKSLGPRPSLSSSQDQIGRFDRDFTVLEEIGSGEFGKVMKAQLKAGSDEETYAIKKSKRFEGVKHRHRLREEADILRHLSQGKRHPNVLAFLDSWEEDEVLYIQTEICELGSLGHFLWEYGRAFPRLDEARVWKIIADLSNGLKFIHDSGVIHLDVKPANIFVTSEGRFKIGDFGMASLWPRPIQSNPSIPTSAFEREGDKLYLAPEVLQGKYGKAADVFSFGMTMLETATNIVVPDQGEAWHRLRREDFSQVDLDESPELLELVRQMMRTDPAERITIHGVFGHDVVSRVRVRMEMMYEKAKREGSVLFAASPLASVSEGFLEEILGRSGAMDVGM